jgi:hypothetical protein
MSDDIWTNKDDDPTLIGITLRQGKVIGQLAAVIQSVARIEEKVDLNHSSTIASLDKVLVACKDNAQQIVCEHKIACENEQKGRVIKFITAILLASGIGGSISEGVRAFISHIHNKN